MGGRGIRRIQIPAPPPGFHRIQCQVGIDGRYACLFSTFDTGAAWRRFVEGREGKPSRQLEAIPPDSRGLIAVALGQSWRDVAAFRVESYSYKFDVAADDFCVIADMRSESGETNAATYEKGKQGATFHAGDAINHLQCDASGGVWAGYFDEGVFGDTIARHGIVRFNRVGEVLSYYPGDIADCYSLNVSKRATWSCWYTGFAAVELDLDCHERRWANDLISGVSAIAVSEPYVLLVSGYPPERNRIVLAEMRLKELRLVGAFDAPRELGVDLERAWFTARGNMLHIVVDEECLSVSVEHFASLQAR